MGFLVVLEGIDGSGKGTQARRLTEACVAAGLDVSLLSFPRYDETRFGRAIAEYLNGRFGTLEQVHPQLAAVLFAGDRFESLPRLTEALANNAVVICDRYVASNLAHQAARLPEIQQAQLIDWIDQVEYDVFGLPRPDLVILLDLPVDVAEELIARKAPRDYTDAPADLQEADRDYQAAVAAVYDRLAGEIPGWIRVDCQADGQLRSVEDIGEDVWTAVRDRLQTGDD